MRNISTAVSALKNPFQIGPSRMHCRYLTRQQTVDRMAPPDLFSRLLGIERSALNRRVPKGDNVKTTLTRAVFLLALAASSVFAVYGSPRKDGARHPTRCFGSNCPSIVGADHQPIQWAKDDSEKHDLNKGPDAKDNLDKGSPDSAKDNLDKGSSDAKDNLDKNTSDAKDNLDKGSSDAKDNLDKNTSDAKDNLGVGLL
jgi:hypothetical protein